MKLQERMYQERIIVGRGKLRRVYTLLENHFFIEFHIGVSDSQIKEFLKKYNLELVEIPLPLREENLPKEEEAAPKMGRRWVKAPPEMDISAIAKVNIVRRVAPVYVEEGRGIESSAAPLPDVLLLETPQELSRNLLNILKDRFDMEDVPTMSRLLGKFSYFVIRKEGESKFTAYEILDQVRQLEGVTFTEYDWVMMQPDALIPNDFYWANQWNMVRINMVDGWDIQTGNPSVIIAVLDSGCDLGHPDLTYTPAADHFNAQEAALGNPPPYNAGPVRAHGTNVAGLAAAILNTIGIAGVAGGCTVLPAYHGDTGAGEAASINWAVAHGANVINMSSYFPPDAVLQTAVQNADAAGVVMAAASGNFNVHSVNFPAAYPEVIAVGASDQNDERKRPTSPDGECWWGSQWGAELDVMAPGVLCWSTDWQGAAGYNQNGNPRIITAADAPCLGPGGTLTYPTTGDAAGDYYANFNGTSAATPHVAGLAALLISQYPTLTNREVRNIIERTCEKVSPGTYAYAHQPGRLNGTWHQEMGYGRINAHRALRYCDLYIADHDLDDGTVPSSELVGGIWTPRRFWVWQPFVRQDDTGTHPSQHLPADPNVDNWVYAIVTNLGPATADLITVRWHLMDYPGTALVYPADWNPGNQIAQTTLTNVLPGSSVVAKALWPQASVATQIVGLAHPCMVVEAICDQDLGGDIGTHVVEYNNIAQHNISYLPLDADAVPKDNPDMAALTLPFVIGNAASLDRYAELVFDLSKLKGATAYLDPIPQVEFGWIDKVLDEERNRREVARGRNPSCFEVTFLDKARLKLSICGCSSMATIQQGTSYRMDCYDGIAGRLQLDRLVMREGVSRVTRSGREMIRLSGTVARLGIPLDVGERIVSGLVIVPPATPTIGDQHIVDIAQTNGFRLVGGLSFVITVR